MSRYRKIDQRIWNDEKFRSLDDSAKLLFFCLLTHPSMTMLGGMRSTVAGLAEELGWSVEAFREAFQQVLQKGMAEHDQKAHLIALPNFLVYNRPESPNVVKSWGSALDLLPECALKTRVVARCKAFVEGLTEGFVEALPDAFRQPMPNQEQEQEQEQEQKKEPTGSVGKTDLPACRTQDVVDAYHAALPELPGVKLMNDGRRKATGKLWRWVLTSTKTDGTRRAETAEQALAWIKAYFERARENDFIMGRGAKAPGHEGWRCDFDFLLTDKGKKHVIEKTGGAS
ncbi:hypothetical protein [Variovorax paradoxus]|uniref:hypothetical protein n=1 Tax=Variovorax paradoxus TaxID=34073 RepID=UPI0027805B44|nr:hypothetical protein [Variovorax paradoxus]MDQ0590993.1 hypothetical protein [Variovorax paradoxus]